jgi:hypothetical protein
MRFLAVASVLLAGSSALAACGQEKAATPVALPPSGTAYRALDDHERLTVAAGCRDRAAAVADGVAAEQIESIDAHALRDHLDAAFRLIRQQRRPVTAICAEQLPFVTPGLRLRFDGALDSGDAFTYETESTRPLTIRGAVAPATTGTVTVRREFGPARSHRAQIAADGRFALPTLRLRKVANNTFILSFHAPPNAPRKAYFSAICLDCLAGGAPAAGAGRD